jgi:hypothetical protein
MYDAPVPRRGGRGNWGRVVESWKVTPNDAHVERAQDRFLRLAIEEEPHHGLDATRGLGAELLPALGFIGVDRDPVLAFAAQVMDDHVKSEPTTTTGGNSDRRLAHRLIIHGGIIHRGLSRTIAQQLKRIPDDKLLAAQAKSYRRSSGSATPVAPVSTKISGGCALSTCPSLAAAPRRFLALTREPTRPLRVLGSVIWENDGGRTCPPRHDHVVAPKPS